MKPWMGMVFDGFIVACLSVLLALKAIPAEAYLSLVGALVGARAIAKFGGGTGGGDGTPPALTDGQPSAKPSAGVSGLARGSAAVGLLAAVGAVIFGRGHS